MSEIDVQAETWNVWENSSDELNKLRKEMAERVVEKMGEKDLTLLIWKKLVTDYLVDEWWWEDKVNDFFLWVGLNMFSKYTDQLEDLRIKINQTKSKEEIDESEKSIIESLWNPSSSWWEDLPDDSRDDSWDISNSVWATTWAVTWTVVSSTTSSSEGRRYDNLWTSTEYAPVWEAVEIPLDERMDRLFPEWEPKNEKEMKKYITEIKVPVRTSDGKEKKMSLLVHKKLAKEYEAIFQDMFNAWIPVNPDKTWWYNWRTIRRWDKRSHHSYWSAVDVNWDVNGWVYGKTDKNSSYYNDEETVAIRKKHGFYRWWDWSKGQNDPMHFSYMNA